MTRDEILANFKQAYDQELQRIQDSITELHSDILNHYDTRAFVYEVFKRLLAQRGD